MGLIIILLALTSTITGIVGALFFWFIGRFVLRFTIPHERLVTIYPLAVFLAVSLNLFIVIFNAV